MKKHFLLLSIGILTSIFSLFAQIPVGYYDAAHGKSEAELKTAMHQIIRNFINLDFEGFTATFWGENYFRRTDWHPEGHFWDMYSNERRAIYNSAVMDREHAMPRSWWRNTSLDNHGRANSDLHNLFPSDAAANRAKSNWPLGEVDEADTNAWRNGVINVGRSSIAISGFSGRVFEPPNEYKGDFARTFLYMVTSYEDYANRWTTNEAGTMIMPNNTFPTLTDYAVNLLLEWHRNDPVSEKERNRNDSVFALQQNRNPFIDFPNLVEYIWGDRQGQTFSVSNQAIQPTLITPSIEGVSVNFGNVQPTQQQPQPRRTRNIPVRGVLLTSPLTVEILDDADGSFSVENTITATQANAIDGYFLPITYSPDSQGTHTARLQISSSELPQPIIVHLQGNRPAPLTPIPPVTPTDDMDVIIFHRGTSATGAWAVANLPANFTPSNRNTTPYANGDFSFRNNGEWLIVEFDEQADILQFAILPRNAWGENENYLHVFEGVDANSFRNEPTVSFSNEFVVNSVSTPAGSERYNNTPEISLRSDTRAIRIEYFKVAQNVGINNLIIARKREPTNTNPIYGNNVIVFHENGLLHIQNIGIGESIHIYDVLGNLIAQRIINEQQTTIPMHRKGVFLLKANSGVYRFVAR